METKFASQDSILDKLSEKFYFSRSWEGKQGGVGHFVPPSPLARQSSKKACPGEG